MIRFILNLLGVYVSTFRGDKKNGRNAYAAFHPCRHHYYDTC